MVERTPPHEPRLLVGFTRSSIRQPGSVIDPVTGYTLLELKGGMYFSILEETGRERIALLHPIKLRWQGIQRTHMHTNILVLCAAPREMGSSRRQ